jgi:hypothetical protein
MKKAIRICLVAALCVVIVVGYYYYLSHKNDNASGEETVELTEVDKIIAKDFDQDYPSTPRGVVKWYNRIITAFYAEDYTDEELEEMADQIRLLLDDELLSYNSREDYLASLKTDIEDYKSRDKKILQSKVSDSSDVTYATVDGDYCAYVNAYYFAKEGNDYSRTYEEYVLRRDEEGRWKILAFQLTDGEDE